MAWTTSREIFSTSQKSRLSCHLPRTRPDYWLSEFAITEFLSKSKDLCTKTRGSINQDTRRMGNYRLSPWVLERGMGKSWRGPIRKNRINWYTHLKRHHHARLRAQRKRRSPTLFLLTPRGIESCKVTSIEKILAQEVDATEVRKRLATNFAKTFNLDWTV